jgi:hypothetical protein
VETAIRFAANLIGWQLIKGPRDPALFDTFLAQSCRSE